MKRILVALTSVLMMSAANAGLVHGDWKTSGDNRVTIDLDTGVEWLKLNNTKNMSVNQVLAQLGDGGSFDGWRLPTSDEVQNMVETILPEFSFNEGQTTYSSGSYRGYTDRWRSWMGTVNYYLTGDGSSNNRYWYSYGLHVEDDGEVNMSGTFRRQKWYRKYTHWATIYEDYGSYSMDHTSTNVGIYLVSDGGVTLSSINDPTLNAANPNSPANLSVPGAVAALGIAGLFGWRRRNA